MRDQLRTALAQERVEALPPARLDRARPAHPVLQDRVVLERDLAHVAKEVRIHLLDAINHEAEQSTRLLGHVARRGHAPQPIQPDARDRVHQCGMACDRNHIACGLDGAHLDVALDRLAEGGRLARRKSPQDPEPLAHDRLQELGQVAIRLPGFENRVLIQRALLAAQ